MSRKTAVAVATAFVIGSVWAAPAQSPEKISDGVVKIGLLLDMSSIYADITGVGSVDGEAEGFGAGGVFMWPIVMCSVVAVAIVCERFWTLQSSRVIPRDGCVDVH